MEYMDVTTASEKWGITGRRIRILCNDGRIDGAVRNGWTWQIPVSSPKPGDGRVLRKFRNYDIRPGYVDVDALAEARVGVESKGLKENFISLLPSTISFLFSAMGDDVSSRDCREVLNGELSYSLSLEEHLLIVNFTSILKSFFSNHDMWNGGKLKDVYVRLMQGIRDTDGEYEEREIKTKDEEAMSVKDAMETTLRQYEASWSKLHPLSSALILSGEIMRISPYSKAMPFYFYLVLAGEMLRRGLLPPLSEPSLLDEGRAAFSLVYSKGIYTDLTALSERMTLKTYMEIKANV